MPLSPRKDDLDSFFWEVLNCCAKVVQEFLREILDELGMIDRGYGSLSLTVSGAPAQRCNTL